MPSSYSFLKKSDATLLWVSDVVRLYMSKEMPNSSKLFFIIEWYLSTTSCGVMPSFLARIVMGTPCSSLPPMKITSWCFMRR